MKTGEEESKIEEQQQPFGEEKNDHHQHLVFVCFFSLCSIGNDDNSNSNNIIHELKEKNSNVEIVNR